MQEVAKTLTLKTVKDFSAAAEKVLNELGKQFGVKVQVGNATYNGSSTDVVDWYIKRVSVTKIGGLNQIEIDLLEQLNDTYKFDKPLTSLPTFKFSKGTITLTGYKHGSPRFPYLGEVSWLQQPKRKFAESYIKSVLAENNIREKTYEEKYGTPKLKITDAPTKKPSALLGPEHWREIIHNAKNN